MSDIIRESVKVNLFGMCVGQLQGTDVYRDQIDFNLKYLGKYHVSLGELEGHAKMLYKGEFQGYTVKSNGLIDNLVFGIHPHGTLKVSYEMKNSISITEMTSDEIKEVLNDN